MESDWACFRPLLDIIFFIYLYQRWIYPIDKKRTNEFGTPGSEEPTEGAANQAIEGAQTPAATADSAAHPKSE